LRFSPISATTSLHLLQLAAGITMVFALYDVGRQTRIPRGIAVAVTLVVCCGPTVVLYESWLNYDYFVTVALLVLVSATVRWVRTGSARWFVVLSATATAATLTRSLLHPVWLAGVILLALALRSPERWTAGIVVGVSLPVVLVGLLVVKNEVLFGSPQLSSLAGTNLARTSVTGLPPNVTARLRARGVVTAPVTPEPCVVRHPRVPILAEEYQRVTDNPTTAETARPLNWNWECALQFSKLQFKDALRAARAEPGWTAKSIAGSAEIWAQPASLYFEVAGNRDHIATLDKLYRRAELFDSAWKPPIRIYMPFLVLVESPDYRFHVSPIVVGATLLVILGGIVVLARRREGVNPARSALLMGSANVAYVTLASILFEHGENNRFRFIVEPLTAMLAVAIVVWAVRRLRVKRGLQASLNGSDRRTSA